MRHDLSPMLFASLLSAMRVEIQIKALNLSLRHSLIWS